MLSNDNVIYRALTQESQIKKGRVAPKVFRLRPATEQHPEEETYLSVGKTVAGANIGLTGVISVAQLIVGEVHALPYDLQVNEIGDEHKAGIFGIPRQSEIKANPDMQDRELTITKELADLANRRPLLMD